MTIQITNEQLLQVTFGDMWPYAHVCSFPDDPNNISNDRKGLCWAGDYYSRYRLQPGTNQFFCISLFAEEEVDGKVKSRRRKKNFSGTYVIGLDDVREKLSPVQAERLPIPTYKLKSSMYSEQWFYVLKTPETNRNRVDNLLDQLIANGLAPNGTDPGMKGVTRYLRLPEGYNTKASRVRENGGIAPKCEIIEWNPDNKYTMEELAIPFSCDLDAPRAEGRVDGAVEMNDHPVLKMLNVKSMLSAGRYDITCPWVDEHTDNDDSGSAIFTNEDGSFGFQCHHGHCQERTAGDVVNALERQSPGFKLQFNAWKGVRSVKSFDSVVMPDFMGNTKEVVIPDFMGIQPPKVEVLGEVTQPLVDIQSLLNEVRIAMPGSDDQKLKCEQFARAVDSFPNQDRIGWHDQVAHIMGWSKTDFQRVLKDYRASWYASDRSSLGFFKEWVYVSSQNQFYNTVKHNYLPIDAFRNSFLHLDPEVLKSALQHKMSQKVHAVEYAPGKPAFFEVNGNECVNSWDDRIHYGNPGDCTTWLKQWDVMGWEEHRTFMLQWMRHTIVRPEVKINYAMLLGGAEGAGKDFLLYPMRMALGSNSIVIDGDKLLDNFNEYMVDHKHLHFNEVEFGDHQHAKAIYNKLKPIIAAPPERLSVNIKGLRQMLVRNLFNVTITSNKYIPLQVDQQSRRYFMLWTDFKMRDDDTGQFKPEVKAYWKKAWDWMHDESEGGQGGWRSCVYYMMNHVSEEGFEPKSPPHITDYMKEVQDMSMSTLEFELNGLIVDRVGCFQCDMVTSHDALNTLRVHSAVPGNVTASTVGKVLSAMGYRGRLRPVISGVRRRVYTIRNSETYNRMELSKVAQVYLDQRAAIEKQGNVVSIL